MASPCVRAYATQPSPKPSSLAALPPQIRKFVEDQVALCQPDNVHICDGSEAEQNQLMTIMQRAGMIKPLPKHENW
jgi:phosphoenolpyruvate carboxykinase (GTP)